MGDIWQIPVLSKGELKWFLKLDCGMCCNVYIILHSKIKVVQVVVS